MNIISCKFDYLYARSERGDNFYSLIELIISENNLRLAYRNIKTNKGSKTNGLSGKNLSFIANWNLHFYVKFIRNLIMNYEPSEIMRVGIPKANGKIRYLGIKEPWDKIIEQAIYQVLEPILTAEFHNNSNGFIKGRSTKRAIAQLENYIIKDKLYYAIDLDIKGFFDNVEHGKLLKQLWSCGIRDKNLISLLSKMLKAKVKDVGIPERGTPQGGILSPLLANVYLNELDWWLESKAPKGIRFVRYADDVVILCPTYSVARNMLELTTDWLSKRLKLEVSEEKTKIVNLKKNYTTFLGVKLKVKEKNGKIKIVSHMSDKAIKNFEEKTDKQIRKIKKVKSNKKKCEKEVDLFNYQVMGTHNYYDMATFISEDVIHANIKIYEYIIRNLSDVLTYSNEVKENDYITNKYGNGRKLPYIRGKPIIPIGRINYNPERYRGNKINYFKEENRNLFHKKLEITNLFVLNTIVNNPNYNQTVEFNDNVISKFCGQLGKYAITNKPVFNISNMCAMKIKTNGNNKYDNIIIVESKVKKLIELQGVDDIIELYKLKRGFTIEQLEKINEIRKENNLPLI